MLFTAQSLWEYLENQGHKVSNITTPNGAKKLSNSKETFL